MSQTITGNQQPITPVGANLTPSEGPRVIPLTLAFATSQSYTINLAYQQQQMQISVIQSMFVDNSLNTTPLVLTFGNNLQSITIPGGYQGYLNIDCPNPPIIVATCSGGQNVKLLLQNFECEPILWSTGGDPEGGTTPLPVSDAILESAYSSGALNVNIVSGGSTPPTIPAGQTEVIYGTSGNPNFHFGTSPVTVWSFAGFNTTTAWVFAHFINSNSSIGGTDWFIIGIPPGGSVTHNFGAYGLVGTNTGGMSVYLTGSGALADTTAIPTGGTVGASVSYSNATA